MSHVVDVVGFHSFLRRCICVDLSCGAQPSNTRRMNARWRRGIELLRFRAERPATMSTRCIVLRTCDAGEELVFWGLSPFLRFLFARDFGKRLELRHVNYVRIVRPCFCVSCNLFSFRAVMSPICFVALYFVRVFTSSANW